MLFDSLKFSWYISWFLKGLHLNFSRFEHNIHFKTRQNDPTTFHALWDSLWYICHMIKLFVRKLANYGTQENFVSFDHYWTVPLRNKSFLAAFLFVVVVWFYYQSFDYKMLCGKKLNPYFESQSFLKIYMYIYGLKACSLLAWNYVAGVTIWGGRSGVT